MESRSRHVVPPFRRTFTREAVISGSAAVPNSESWMEKASQVYPSPSVCTRGLFGDWDIHPWSVKRLDDLDYLSTDGQLDHVLTIRLGQVL